jgi:hypothetical protein
MGGAKATPIDEQFDGFGALRLNPSYNWVRKNGVVEYWSAGVLKF